MMRFADRLQAIIERNTSVVVAGFDPVIDTLPSFCIAEALGKSDSDDALCYRVLISFYECALEALHTSVAAIKPNLAFFEQYGLPGVRAFHEICSKAKVLGLPIIADGKRGDIGSTAAAYSAAFLGRVKRPALNAQGALFPSSTFDVDALTVNPFLGFETVQIFIDDCIRYDKGIFVLVKTSNPGSGDVQNLIANDSRGAKKVSTRIAEWLAEKAPLLEGDCGYSGLGAVVGATYPSEAYELREQMPHNFFLIPGMGAQGGTAHDAVAGFSQAGRVKQKGAALINLSRGLLGNFAEEIHSYDALIREIRSRAARWNKEVQEALLQRSEAGLT